MPPIEGHIVFDTDEKMGYCWDGTVWQKLWDNTIPFLSGWDLTIDVPSANYVARIGLSTASGLIIRWGDSTIDDTIANDTITFIEHTYTTAGVYTIQMSGSIAQPTQVTPGFDGTNNNLSAILTATSKIEAGGLTSCLNIFRNCTRLTTLPPDLFQGCPNINTFSYGFQNCSGLTSLPASLFSGNPLVTTFAITFQNCSGLTAVPAGLFAGNPNVTSFQNCFDNCPALATIPAGLFDNNVNATNFSVLFNGSAISVIPPGLFDNNVAAIDMSYIFQQCRNITSIPPGLFDNNINVTSFQNTFNNCSGITVIPPGLFDNNLAVVWFPSVFGSTSITSIPPDLFDNNIAALRFDYAFYGCAGITVIPTGLFDLCPNVTTFNSCFLGTSITDIPVDIFSGNPLVTDMGYAFWGCTLLTSIPVTLFAGNTAVTIFRGTFMNCTGVIGAAPDLWVQYPTADGTGCFQNDTQLTNYAVIPTAWKTGALEDMPRPQTIKN